MRPNELSGMTDRYDREYFRIHLDGTTADAHIGHPIRGRRTGVEVIPVSYPVRHSDGRLMGVLVALIDVDALERIWVDIGFKPEDRIALIGEDNKVWFSWSGATAGPAVPGSKSWSRTISGWPMRVVATLDQATVDRESSGPRRAVIASAAAGSTLIGLFCLLLARRASVPPYRMDQYNNRVDAEGYRVDSAGHRMPIQGSYYTSATQASASQAVSRDEFGNRYDAQGNRIDARGRVVAMPASRY